MVSFINFLNFKVISNNFCFFFVVNELPVLKADALKFLMTFRSLLGQEIIIGSLPHMIKHLQASSAVVHSYAACALDKVLVLKVEKNQPM